MKIIGLKKFLWQPNWLSWEFFSSNYSQIGQHVVLLHILIPYIFSGPLGLAHVADGKNPQRLPGTRVTVVPRQAIVCITQKEVSRKRGLAVGDQFALMFRFWDKAYYNDLTCADWFFCSISAWSGQLILRNVPSVFHQTLVRGAWRIIRTFA